MPFVKLNGPEPGPRRVCTNLNASVEFVEGEGLLLMLDTQGIAVASGTSCVSKALKVSHVLTAMGVDHTLAQGILQQGTIDLSRNALATEAHAGKGQILFLTLPYGSSGLCG